jgi:ATP-dependent Clp protease ATP-binding subunit ClpA
LRRLIQKEVEDLMAKAIIAGQVGPQIKLDYQNGSVVVS